MWKDPNIFRQAIETAKNHIARAAEGRELLKKGRPLNEMTTSISGLTHDQNDSRRTEYLEWIARFDDVELARVYKNILIQLHNRIHDQDAGYSELLWQRIAFLDEFEKRNLSAPEDN